MLNIFSKIFTRLGLFFLAGYLSPAILFLTNLVPLIGAAYFDWDANDIILIYIFETGIILFFALLKIIYIQVIGKNDAYLNNLTSEQLKNSTLSIFLSDVFSLFKNSFFAIIICVLVISAVLYLVLFIILIILDKNFLFQEPITYALSGSTQGFWIALAAITIEHIFLFINNFLIQKEYNYFHPFAIPLKRTFLLVLAMMILAGTKDNFSQQNLLYLTILIVLKMIGELSMLVRESEIKRN